jgi:hypothetical protein
MSIDALQNKPAVASFPSWMMRAQVGRDKGNHSTMPAVLPSELEFSCTPHNVTPNSLWPLITCSFSTLSRKATAQVKNEYSGLSGSDWQCIGNLQSSRYMVAHGTALPICIVS